MGVSKYIIDEETAELTFLSWMDDVDRETDTSQMDDEDAKDFEGIKRRIIRAIMRGRLVVDDKSRMVYTTFMSDELDKAEFKFKPLGAKNYASMDDFKANRNMTKLHGLMASVTKHSINQVNKLEGSDYDVCMDIMKVFLGK